MKRKLIALFVLSSTCSAYAQTAPEAAMKKLRDSMTMVYLSEFAKRQPMLRQGGISYDVSSNTNSKMLAEDGTLLYQGDMEISRMKMNFNLPISSWGKNRLNGAVVYQKQHYAFGQNFNAGVPSQPGSLDRASVGLSATYSRSDSLFNRPVIYSAGITAFSNELNSIRRLSYSGTMIFPLKQQANTMTNVGVVLAIGPNGVLPVPFFSYWHRFNSKLEFDLQLPYGASFRIPFSTAAWATFGTALDPNFSFLSKSNPNAPANLTHNMLDLKTGLSLEHMLGKKLVAGVRGGLVSNLSSRVQKDNADVNDYLLKMKRGTVPFVNFSLSFLPFLKSIR
ncbi:hypothetical protein [Pedobacter sp. GR22-6]|uniref:hypothetical protein n=1 Tax=Pedobacter sp. GR22-6 TaxID=3127957 RepID=UPI00307F8800